MKGKVRSNEPPSTPSTPRSKRLRGFGGGVRVGIRNVQVLHLDLKAVDGNYVDLRYFVDNPNQYERRSLCFQRIIRLLGGGCITGWMEAIAGCNLCWISIAAKAWY